MRVARTLQTGTAAGQREVLQKSHCAGSRQFVVLLPDIPMKHQGFITVLFAAPRKHPRTIQTYSYPNMILLPCYSCVYFCLDFIVNQQCVSLRKAVTTPKLLGVWKLDTKLQLYPKKKEPLLALARILGEGGRRTT